MDKLKRIKRRRVFASDSKDQPVLISRDDFSRIQFIIECLCNISDLEELHECRSILFLVSMENYINDLKAGVK